MSAATQLSLWVGRKGRGSARLRWGDHELAIYVNAVQIVAVEGDDGERLAPAFGLISGGEWFREAHAAVAAGHVSQGEANAVVKRALAESLREFFLAPDAAVAFDPAVRFESQSLTISYPHLIAEMVLGSGGEALAGVFLPHPEWVLRQLPDFGPRVGALGLTEEAMAVLAKIIDARTAQEIADPSPHGKEMALRLLAAAIAAGLVEAAPRITEVPLVAAAAEQEEPAEPRRGRVLRWVFAVLLLAAAVAALMMTQPWKPRTTAGPGGPWAIAVDGGCQPSEVERLYRRQDRDPASFRVVPFGQGTEQCYGLVWGHFPTREAAEQGIAQLPGGVLEPAFKPRVVQVEGTAP